MSVVDSEILRAPSVYSLPRGYMAGIVWVNNEFGLVGGLPH